MSIVQFLSIDGMSETQQAATPEHCKQRAECFTYINPFDVWIDGKFYESAVHSETFGFWYLASGIASNDFSGE